MQKYTTIDQTTRLPDGRNIHRIKALRDFGTIKAGTIGGFIMHWENLSQTGNCWVAEDAVAAGLSRISENALLTGRAMIDDRVMLAGSVIVRDEAYLYDHVFVYGNAIVGEKSVIAGIATVCDEAVVLCRARFSSSGKTKIPNIRDMAFIRDRARLEGSVCVRDNALVGDDAVIRGNARITEKARVLGSAIVENLALAGEEASILQSARIGGRSKSWAAPP